MDPAGLQTVSLHTHGVPLRAAQLEQICQVWNRLDVVLRRTLKSGGLVALIRPLAHAEAMSTKQEHGKVLWKPYPFCTGRRRPTLT